MLGNCGVNWLPVSTSSDGSHTHTHGRPMTHHQGPSDQQETMEKAVIGAQRCVIDRQI